MVDDLYDARLAKVDFWTLLAGVTCLVTNAFGGQTGLLSVGSGAVMGGAVLFAANIALVVQKHGVSAERDVFLERVRETLLGRN